MNDNRPAARGITGLLRDVLYDQIAGRLWLHRLWQ
jgi:hypothetical protein